MDNKKLLQEIKNTISRKEEYIKKRMTETEIFVKTEKENIHVFKNIQYSVELIQKQIDEKENVKIKETVGLAKCCNNCENIRRNNKTGVAEFTCVIFGYIEREDANNHWCNKFSPIGSMPTKGDFKSI